MIPSARFLTVQAILWGALIAVTSAGLFATPAAFAATAEDDDDFEFEFDDGPRRRDVDYPKWFKLSFLDLREDLAEALANGKRGLMVYFGQAHCAYCQALMEVNFQDQDIVAYTQTHFEVVPIDVWGDKQTVSMRGEELTEKELAARENTVFTPSIIFYNADAQEVFRLRGYYPPYKFRAALEYVADAHYRRETFRHYLERADPTMAFEAGALIEEDFFSPPPYALDRSRLPGQRTLVVFFEQGVCHACDVLHTEPLGESNIRKMLGQLEAVQLDMWSDTPVLTPGGRRLTARKWAEDLGLFYAPSLVFFDEQGEEIMRVDSVLRFHRFDRVLRYVLTGAYREHRNFLRWWNEYGTGAHDDQ